MVETLARIAASNRFQNFVTGVILLAAVLVGLETYPRLVERHGILLHALDKVVLGIFVLEILIKLGAEGRRPWRFFRDPWNVFDFLVVALAFMPIGGQHATVLRLVRLLRVLRLVRAMPRLQILVTALLKSIPSMGYVSLLLSMVFYVYAVGGVFLFAGNDPFRFGSLQVALVTLAQVATAEDWSTTLYTQMYGCDAFGYEGREALCVAPQAFPLIAPLYFISFILLATMIILNLFIGVIMNGMTEAQSETADLADRERLLAHDPSEPTLKDELARLEAQLKELQSTVSTISRRVALREEIARGKPDSPSA